MASLHGPFPRSKGGVPGWLCLKEGRWMPGVLGRSGWENCKPQWVWVKGCGACSHRGLTWQDLELFVDLHFLTEHPNFNALYFSFRWPIYLIWGDSFLWPSQTDQIILPALKVEKYGPCDYRTFIIYHFLLFQFYNHTYSFLGYLLPCKKLL